MNIGNRSSQHAFATNPSVHIPRSAFDRSFPVKDTFDFDYLIPIFSDEILPGDDINLTVSNFARLATEIRPVMDNMYIDWFFFFVPNRLVWSNWEKFQGAQRNPGDSVSYVLPSLDQFPAGGPEVGTIYDKFGLPTDVTGAWTLTNTLPLRAYNLIWNEWFRDQNLQNSVINNVDDGPDQIADFTLLKRNRKHDYFSSCLPFLQKGTAVTLPLGTTAPVVTAGTGIPSFTSGASTDRRLIGDGSSAVSWNAATANGTAVWHTTSLQADLTNASAATINALRQAIQVQALLELDARGGTRYVEALRARFGVVSPDFRLQRPEYLGGGSQRINSHPIAQTSPTAGANPQGQLAGFATSSSQGQIGFSKSFVEHGYVIGLCCARADVTYQQGLERFWSRSTRYDFFEPMLQDLGEQAVLNKEIDLRGAGGTDTSTFGYQERYAEYRYKPGGVRGEFRSTYATSLDTWHLAEEFATVPALNSTFIPQNTPVDRVIAVTTEPHLIMDCFFHYRHARPMKVRSIPVSLGRL